jgi:hypothetical protein
MALNHTTVSSSSMMAPPPPPPKNAGVETNDIQKRMAPWTAQMRDAFIKRALESEFTKGNQGPYYYNVLPKLNNGVQEPQEPTIIDLQREKVTETIAKVIYSDPEFKCLSLNIYNLLISKMVSHPLLSQHIFTNIVVLIKGSNAQMYMAAYPNDVFAPSDLDISIMISPYLGNDMFCIIRDQIEIIVKQTISQYKRTLDHMLFLNRPIDTAFMAPEQIERFKKALERAFGNIDVCDDKNDKESENTVVNYVSSTTDDNFRNTCSRNSFLITNRKFQSEDGVDEVVKIELPHFDKCERIPLRKTPLFCSFNETLDFNREKDGDTMKRGKFNLYRLRWNHLRVSYDSEKDETFEHRIPADFIDISIPDITDEEFRIFWNYGQVMQVYDRDVNSWLIIPDLKTTIMEHQRILDNYVCQKREKKERKLAELMRIARTFMN